MKTKKFILVKKDWIKIFHLLELKYFPPKIEKYKFFCKNIWAYVGMGTGDTGFSPQGRMVCQKYLSEKKFRKYF